MSEFCHQYKPMFWKSLFYPEQATEDLAKMQYSALVQSQVSGDHLKTSVTLSELQFDKREIIKSSSSFSIKISEKNKTKN